jgi:hypothetical protein
MTSLTTSLGPLARLASLCVGALLLNACVLVGCPDDENRSYAPAPPATNHSPGPFDPCSGEPEMAHLQGRALSAYEGVPVRAAHVGGWVHLNYPSTMQPTCGSTLVETVVTNGAFRLAVPEPPFAEGSVQVYLDVDRDGVFDPSEPHWSQDDSPPDPEWARLWVIGPAEFARIRNVELSVVDLPSQYTQMLAAFDPCGFGPNLRYPCTMYREPTPPPVPDTEPFGALLRYDATATDTFEVSVSPLGVGYPKLHFLGPLGAPHCQVDDAFARCVLTRDDFEPASAPTP